MQAALCEPTNHNTEYRLALKVQRKLMAQDNTYTPVAPQ